MAIASLALFALAVTAFVDYLGIHGAFWWILETRFEDWEVYRITERIALVASISGLTLGIWSICSGKRRRMGIVGTVLNPLVMVVTILVYLVYQSL